MAENRKVGFQGIPVGPRARWKERLSAIRQCISTPGFRWLVVCPTANEAIAEFGRIAQLLRPLADRLAGGIVTTHRDLADPNSRSLIRLGSIANRENPSTIEVVSADGPARSRSYDHVIIDDPLAPSGAGLIG